MIVHDITETEDNHQYRELEYFNLLRQLHFLSSIINTSLQLNQRFLSETVIKALNYHAIACLHTNAGEYRPCQVSAGQNRPYIDHHRVPALMEHLTDIINSSWGTADPLALASYVYWRLNYIHPFINGNGRTARACCYFVLCVKVGNLLTGSIPLPALLVKNRDECVNLLREVDSKYLERKPINDLIEPLAILILT